MALESTRAQIRTRLRRKLSEISAGTWSDSELNDIIHDAECKACEECIRQVQHALIEVTVQTARVADQYRYALPFDFIDILIVEHWYNSKWNPLTNEVIHEIHRKLRPGSTSDRLRAFEVFGTMRVILGEEGTAIGGGSSTSLQDTTIDFTAWGIRANRAYAFNDTDDSYAIVTGIAATELTTRALSGGADNLWSAGDSYHVEEIEETLETLNISPVPSTSDDTGDESIQITYARYPLEMASDNDKTEIPNYAMDVLYAAAIIEALQKSKGVTSAEVRDAELYLAIEIEKTKLFMEDRSNTNYHRIRDTSLWGAGSTSGYI